MKYLNLSPSWTQNLQIAPLGSEVDAKVHVFVASPWWFAPVAAAMLRPKCHWRLLEPPERLDEAIGISNFPVTRLGKEVAGNVGLLKLLRQRLKVFPRIQEFGSSDAKRTADVKCATTKKNGWTSDQNIPKFWTSLGGSRCWSKNPAPFAAVLQASSPSSSSWFFSWNCTNWQSKQLCLAATRPCMCSAVSHMFEVAPLEGYELPLGDNSPGVHAEIGILPCFAPHLELQNGLLLSTTFVSQHNRVTLCHSTIGCLVPLSIRFEERGRIQQSQELDAALYFMFRHVLHMSIWDASHGKTGCLNRKTMFFRFCFFFRTFSQLWMPKKTFGQPFEKLPFHSAPVRPLTSSNSVRYSKEPMLKTRRSSSSLSRSSDWQTIKQNKRPQKWKGTYST